ncbi:MAG: hypothetical protein Hals2KO_38560 [Halioglobus sp.]
MRVAWFCVITTEGMQRSVGTWGSDSRFLWDVRGRRLSALLMHLVGVRVVGFSRAWLNVIALPGTAAALSTKVADFCEKFDVTSVTGVDAPG